MLSAFQRVTNRVLKKFLRKNVLGYIDDLLMMSRTNEEHVKMASKVFVPANCKWFYPEGEYLGYLVGQYRLQNVTAYLEKVEGMSPQLTVRELGEFL